MKKSSVVSRSVPQLAFLCVEYDKCLNTLDKSSRPFKTWNSKFIYCVYIYIYKFHIL